MNKKIEPSINSYNISLQELPDISAVIHQRMNRKYWESILRELSEELITLGYSITNNPQYKNNALSELREVEEAFHYALMRGKFPDMPANKIAERFKYAYSDGDTQLATMHFIEVMAELGLFLIKNQEETCNLERI